MHEVQLWLSVTKPGLTLKAVKGALLYGGASVKSSCPRIAQKSFLCFIFTLFSIGVYLAPDRFWCFRLKRGTKELEGVCKLTK